MDLQQFKRTGVMRITQEDIDDPGTRQVIENLFEKQQREWNRQTDELAVTYDISFLWADCIVYLRTRSRWTQELEDRLLAMAQNGEIPPNMFEWPPEKEYWR